MQQSILEVKRNELVSQSRSNIRFKKRLKSHIPSNSRSYNNINMNKLFKDDILEAVIEVIGETDTYEIIISFNGVIDQLERMISSGNKLDLKTVIKAIIRAFSVEDIYLHCSCPDFGYRFKYWATIDRYNFGDPEMRPTEKTNPDGDLGSMCKHGLLVMNNQVWILKIASVINNYIRYMRLRDPKLYELIIQPALFKDKTDDVEYADSNQISMFDKEGDLETEEEENTQSDEEIEYENT